MTFASRTRGAESPRAAASTKARATVAKLAGAVFVGCVYLFLFLLPSALSPRRAATCQKSEADCSALQQQATAALRLPDVLLIGAQKAGTTALAAFLFRHGVCDAQVFDGEPSYFNKEVHFFDDRYDEGVEFYARRYARCASDALLLDATPDTLPHAERVKSTYAAAGGSQDEAVKVLLLLRNPVDREYSLYRHMIYEYDKSRSHYDWYSVVARPDETVKSFTEFVDTVTVPAVQEGSNYGLYSVQLQRWFELFDRRQILLLSYDEFKNDPDKTLARVGAFLGKEYKGRTFLANRAKSASANNQGTAMTCADRQRLEKLYHPFNEELFDMLGSSPGPAMEQTPFPKFQSSGCSSALRDHEPHQSHLLQHLFEKHPECSPQTLDPDGGGTNHLDLKKVGRFVRSNGDKYSRYDHQSCFLMQARYNCEKQAPSQDGKATDWKLVLGSKQGDKSPYCDLDEFIASAGGLVNIAKSGLFAPKNNSDSKIDIYFQGNYILRQIFEAVTCGYMDQISDFRAQQKGASMTLDYLQNLNGSLIATSEVGNMLSLDVAKRGCHGVYNNSELPRYYAPNVTVPSNVDGCNDNIAMVEFGSSLRLYYLFHPHLYENPNHLFDLVGMDVNSIDAFVWNDGESNIISREQSRARPMIDINFSGMIEILQEMQIRDAKRHFGANNTWITTTTDYHPCMPGIPDDEVNLILFMLMTGIRFQNRNE